MRLAVLPFLRSVAILIHGINMWSNSTNFRFGVQPSLAGRNDRLLDVADRLDEEPPLLLGKQGVAFALEEPDFKRCD